LEKLRIAEFSKGKFAIAVIVSLVINVLLAKRDRKPPSACDDEPRPFSKFEIPDLANDEGDDATRVYFTDMLPSRVLFWS
jgi:hypothetical protein